jgi:hypothetical protein
MSYTLDAEFWHKEYENASSDLRKAVDRAYKEMRHASTGSLPRMMDRAEELVAAITKYIVQSEE